MHRSLMHFSCLEQYFFLAICSNRRSSILIFSLDARVMPSKSKFELAYVRDYWLSKVFLKFPAKKFSAPVELNWYV